MLSASSASDRTLQMHCTAPQAPQCAQLHTRSSQRIPRCSSRSSSRVHASSSEEPSTSGQQPALLRDPEAKLRSYGAFFGKTFKLPAWLDEVPRVRVRTISTRAQDDLVDLVVLNERLSGEINPWEARTRLELLRKKRRNWEHIYNYVTKADAAATLALIEEANEQAELLLSEEAQERASVSDLKLQLQDLQQQVDEASQRLSATQARVEQNLQRVAELKAEAAALERLQASTGPVASAQTSISSSRAAASASAVASTSAASTATVGAPASSSTSSRSGSSSVATAPAPGRPSSSSGSGARRPRGSSLRPDRGLRSSLVAEQPLKEFWYPAEFSSQLDSKTLVPFELFDEPWVLFRDADGRPSCIRDECAHRACPLSLGEVIDGKVSCAYHGWQFDGDGSCTKMPSTVHCRGVSVAALPCVEKDGFIWVWPGEGVPPEVPSTTQPPEGYDIHAEIKLEVPVEHGLLIENLLDLAHAPFTHQGTFAKDWPVPDVVKFHANQLLSGQWDPYPIDMSFQPPCMTISKIGLAQPGKIMRGVTADNCERHLHQLHVCTPSKKGYTRLLYRMSMDFLGWARYVPGIQEVWKGVAGQVLGEDLKLVLGQQDRLERGSDTWANPVSYDKLGVRYRRWRNGVASGRLPDGATSPGSSKEAAISMTAGELFRLDENEGFCDVEFMRQQQHQAAPQAAQQQQQQEVPTQA